MSLAITAVLILTTLAFTVQDAIHARSRARRWQALLDARRDVDRLHAEWATDSTLEALFALPSFTAMTKAAGQRTNAPGHDHGGISSNGSN